MLLVNTKPFWYLNTTSIRHFKCRLFLRKPIYIKLKIKIDKINYIPSYRFTFSLRVLATDWRADETSDAGVSSARRYKYTGWVVDYDCMLRLSHKVLRKIQHSGIRTAGDIKIELCSFRKVQSAWLCFMFEHYLSNQ